MNNILYDRLAEGSVYTYFDSLAQKERSRNTWRSELTSVATPSGTSQHKTH